MLGAIFRKGKGLNAKFPQLVKQDMKSLGYDVEYIDIMSPVSTRVELHPALSGTPQALAVKEKGLDAPTDQIDMSEGMFRALWLITHINYMVQAGQPGTIAIDDVGEGLDFERACALMKLLLKKSAKHHIQILMSFKR